MTFHMSVRIDGILGRIRGDEESRNEIRSLFNVWDLSEVEKEMAGLKEEGKECFPTGDCDNQDETGRCNGHGT